MVLVSGMGGGTGTGAAPVVADVARSAGAAVLAAAAEPFLFEGTRRRRLARAGVRALVDVADGVVAFRSQLLVEVARRRGVGEELRSRGRGR